MPIQRVLEEDGPNFSTKITITGPNYFFISGNAATKLFTRINKRGVEFGKRMVKVAKVGYRFQTLNSTFKLVQRSSRTSREVTTGVEGDKFVLLVEFDTTPHWAPLAPLERWVAKLKVNPLPPFATPITAHMVQRSIAIKGTKGKKIITRAYPEELEQFGRDVTTDIDSLFMTDQ